MHIDDFAVNTPCFVEHPIFQVLSNSLHTPSRRKMMINQQQSFCGIFIIVVHRIRTTVHLSQYSLMLPDIDSLVTDKMLPTKTNPLIINQLVAKMAQLCADRRLVTLSTTAGGHYGPLKREDERTPSLPHSLLQPARRQ